MDVDASDHTEETKYQDSESSDQSEVPGDFTEYYEVTVSGYIYEGNKQKTPDYVRTMYLDVENIDKNDKNTWRNIYEEIDASYFGEVKLFTKSFLNQCKKYPNYPQTIQMVSRRRRKNRIIRKIIFEGG